MSLSGRTALVTGSTRGIGKAIAFKLAQNGANVIITGKTISPHRFLEGTIFSVAEEINHSCGAKKAIPCFVDVRHLTLVKDAVSTAIKNFDSLDILVNSSSSVKLEKLTELDITNFNLMYNINILGPYNCIKECVKHLSRSAYGGHVVNISPPMDPNPKWFAKNSMFGLSKYGQSLLTNGLSEMFKSQAVAVNSLWSKYVISTSTSKHIYGNQIKPHMCSAELMADALIKIVLKDPRDFTGNFCFAEDLVCEEGNSSKLEYYTLRDDKETPLMPNLFAGDAEECLNIRNYIINTAEMKALLTRVNQLITEEYASSVRGKFSIKFEDVNVTWTIDCSLKNPYFHIENEGLKIGSSRCQLVMTTDTLKDIMGREFDLNSISSKIRMVGDKASAMRAQFFLLSLF